MLPAGRQPNGQVHPLQDCQQGAFECQSQLLPGVRSDADAAATASAPTPATATPTVLRGTASSYEKGAAAASLEERIGKRDNNRVGAVSVCKWPLPPPEAAVPAAGPAVIRVGKLAVAPVEAESAACQRPTIPVMLRSSC